MGKTYEIAGNNTILDENQEETEQQANGQIETETQDEIEKQ